MVRRSLIVNADDFGQSPAANRGIIRAFEQGIVTSSSLMVRWPDAPAAAEYARANPRLSLGLHIDLGEWSLRDGQWVAVYEVVPPGDAQAVAAEIQAQVSRFRRLVGRDPTHLDSHQHVHQRQPVHATAMDLARRMGIPLRHYGPARYCGQFYGQDEHGIAHPEWVSLENMLRILRELPEGLTELCCHPADGDDMTTMYRMERNWELAVLCAPEVRRAVETHGIDLRSFLPTSA